MVPISHYSIHHVMSYHSTMSTSSTMTNTATRHPALAIAYACGVASHGHIGKPTIRDTFWRSTLCQHQADRTEPDKNGQKRTHFYEFPWPTRQFPTYFRKISSHRHYAKPDTF